MKDHNSNEAGTPTLKQIDAIIEQLTQGPHDDAGKVRAELLLESWRKAREMIVDHEFRLLTLSEATTRSRRGC